LVITTPGLAGLAVNSRKLQHDPTVEKLILAAGAAIVVCAAHLLLGERAGPVALAAEVHRTDE
jgi:hypothetical protein